MSEAAAATPWERFAHCPSCGTVRAGVPALRFECASCGFVYHFNPAVAVAGFVSREDGRLLFIRRAKDPGAGRLAVPGGFVDAGERPEEALARELHEEVRAELRDVRYLCSAPNDYVYRGLTYPVVDLFYSARVVDPGVVGAHDSVTSLAWHPPDGVAPEEMAFPSMQAALRRYLDAVRDRD